LNLKATDQLKFSANYTYLSPKETTESRVSYRDTTYNYSLRRPKHSINITAAYSFSTKFYASISAKYVSSRYDVGGYDSNYNPLPDVSLNPYFLLGAYAEFHVCKYAKLFADAQNIGNVKFFDVRGYNSIPFMLNAGITIHL